VSGGLQGVDERVEKDRVDAVVVGDEEFHVCSPRNTQNGEKKE
jgi:hypothetical protein